jgi:pilus assembly protein CpaB
MRSRTLFLLAILMGLITTTLYIFTMNNEKSEAVATEMEIERVEVVVAINQIQANQVITDELIEMKSIPFDQKPEASVQNKEDIINKIATTQIDANEVILNHRVQAIDEESTSLSKKIKDSSRGVSIGLDVVQSVSNLIEPEDYVDVIFTGLVKKGKEEVLETKRIFSNVRVLAIGQKITLTNEDTEIVEFEEVTLELSPDETVKLVNAYETGNLHLALHSRIINE